METRKTNGIGGTSIPVTPGDKGPEDMKDKRDTGNECPHDLGTAIRRQGDMETRGMSAPKTSWNRGQGTEGKED